MNRSAPKKAIITNGKTITERIKIAASKANTAMPSIIGLSPKNDITAGSHVAGSVYEKEFNILVS
jgi:hypothetical protein